ncbi:IS5 family transposase [Porphyromonas gingivalis]|uniref:IS5 family transposase n=1 Tax=Porphyromonas gingivalis TaxID=837 RepID=UPI00265ABFCE|nr:IS5 family transposase [Porphyromonas gingivalis]WKD53452.1 IS5 family transposase [Porphyromonas gingivalis]WKD55503.1 IS5 family transposase [Porphyromonas gingivalis]
MAYQFKNTDEHVTFADALLSKRYRKAQNDFLNQVDRLIDWRPIRTLINKKYTKRQNAIGAPAYDVILLFKMLLLETWYNLSDCALEERINDSITFSRFLGLKMEEVSPDHSTISRFRSALTELGLMDKLLAQFNKQLSRHHISVREGVLVDASLVETPHKPNGSITIEVADDRQDNRSEAEKEAEEDYQKQVVRQRKGTDEEARWVYKQKRYHYGYKKHCLTNVQGIVQKVITTAANRSDTKEFIALLQGANIPQGTVVLADKGYACGENRSYLQTHHLQDGIMHKAQRNRALTEEEKQRNKAIGPIRSTIERTFGSIRRWFHGGRCRYRGLAKTHTQNILESIAFNLYRTPGIIMSSSVG